MVTFAHFGALASVKSWARNHGCWPTTTPKPETFVKIAFRTTTKVTRNHFTPVGEASSAATTTQQQRQQQNISHRWGNVVVEVLLFVTHRWGSGNNNGTTTEAQITPNPSVAWGEAPDNGVPFAVPDVLPDLASDLPADPPKGFLGSRGPKRRQTVKHFIQKLIAKFPPKFLEIPPPETR